MRIGLYCMVAFGIILCATSIVFSWLMFDFRAAGFAFGGIMAAIGVMTCFDSLDRLEEDYEADDIANDD